MGPEIRSLLLGSMLVIPIRGRFKAPAFAAKAAAAAAMALVAPAGVLAAAGMVADAAAQALVRSQ